MKLVRTESSHRHFQELISALDRELWARYGPAQGQWDNHNVVAPASSVVLAYLGEEPVGCGCFKNYDEKTVEIKRMFVNESLSGARYRRGHFGGVGILGRGFRIFPGHTGDRPGPVRGSGSIFENSIIAGWPIMDRIRTGRAVSAWKKI